MKLPKANKVNSVIYMPGLSIFKRIKAKIKLSANESALGPSPKAKKEYYKTFKSFNRYPDSEGRVLKETLSKRLKLDQERIILGSGSDQILELACKAFLKKNDEPYGLDFPVITIRDMVMAQEALLDHFEIEKLLCALGGSMGGMQLLQFCASFPNRTFSAVPIACSSSHSAQNIALNELARQAIMADPEWEKGNYVKTKNLPKNGLAVARMAGHISYLSEKGLQEKFGRKLQEKANYEFSFNADFQVESYLRHQGYSFVDRFDANSYLYITRAMDYFDLSKQYKNSLSEAFKGNLTKFLVISFSSDWLYPTKHSKDIVIALNASGANVAFAEIKTDKGHDSFLVNEPKFLTTIKGFIDSSYEVYRK